MVSIWLLMCIWLLMFLKSFSLLIHSILFEYLLIATHSCGKLQYTAAISLLVPSVHLFKKRILEQALSGIFIFFFRIKYFFQTFLTVKPFQMP